MNYRHPTGSVPKVVDLVALGPSQRDYHAMLHSQYTPGMPKADEVWTLNKGIRSIVCDLAFVLDDLIGEERKSAQYADELRKFAWRTPVITSELTKAERESFPGMFYEYPLREVLEYVGTRINLARTEQTGEEQATSGYQVGIDNGQYMHNSIPMILAYALAIGVREIRLFGCDYTLRSSDHLEANRPNAEYWVGMLRAFGVRVMVAPSTTLLNTDQGRRIYGYARQPKL